MRARDLDLARCHTCGLLQRMPPVGRARCPRCQSLVHLRIVHSIGVSWALLVTAMLAYLPANLYPVMTVVSLGQTQSDTILSGVIYLLLHGDWPLALIVFIASVLVPLLKMIVLSYLLFTAQRRSPVHRAQRARLYRIIELVGRWSMVDIFVVALLAALVQIGNLATIEPGVGAVAFTLVVILSMFAAIHFDPRLIWDLEEPGHERAVTT